MIRIGHSWDTHKLVDGRKLILGGVLVKSDIGLLGHSDADVVLHAVAESLLGSLALGDLGVFYPDNSNKTLNMDSKIILDTYSTTCFPVTPTVWSHTLSLAS